jgi:hypothetical protein
MFYIWHTLLITVFLAIAYGLGYHFGKAKYTAPKVKRVKPKLTLVDTWSDKETSQEDWLKGYHKWKSTQTNVRSQKK